MAGFVCLEIYFAARLYFGVYLCRFADIRFYIVQFHSCSGLQYWWLLDAPPLHVVLDKIIC